MGFRLLGAGLRGFRLPRLGEGNCKCRDEVVLVVWWDFPDILGILGGGGGAGVEGFDETPRLVRAFGVRLKGRCRETLSIPFNPASPKPRTLSLSLKPKPPTPEAP